MAVTEKIVLAVCLFGGFLWLRRRARSVNLENQVGQSMAGVFLLLPALLIGEKYLYDHFLHLGPWTDMLIKAAVTTATFPAVGLLFIKARAEGEAAEEAASGGPGEGA